MATPVFDEYEVLYDWDPEKEEDLALFAGEFVEVIEKYDHGWWLGTIERDGTVFKGYFPKNYIKEKPRPKNAPKPPPRPISLPKPVDNIDQAVAKVTTDVGDLRVLEHPQTNSIRVNRGPSFSLRSITAFDDLIGKGYAIEIKDKDKPARGAAAAAGSLVEMTVHAMIWDGASTFTKTFANGTIKFIVGKHPIVPGLQAAAQSVGVGQSATITCSPPMAYGTAGNPPYVPSNSYIVFEIQIVNVSVPTDPNMEVEGPPSLLTEGVPTVRVQSTNPANKRNSRILLVPLDVNKDNHGYEMGEGVSK
eukprot:gene12158-13298_t